MLMSPTGTPRGGPVDRRHVSEISLKELTQMIKVDREAADEQKYLSKSCKMKVGSALRSFWTFVYTHILRK